MGEDRAGREIGEVAAGYEKWLAKQSLSGNTRYIGLALEALAAEGFEVRREDIERLSPLRYEHVNLLGRYQFSLAEDPLQGGLRPLRRPSILEDD